MSKKKGKDTIPPKSDVAVPVEDLRGKWTLYIDPGDTAFIGHDISLHVVIKNLGPGMVGIPNRQGDHEKLTAGRLLVRVIIGDLIIESMEDKPALVALEFLPWFR